MGRNKYIPNVEDVMKYSDNGRLIFQHELGCIPSRNIKSPLRNGDESPSFEIKLSSSGIWIGRDYGGTQWFGNGIQFVQERYNLTFSEALLKITNDLNIQKISNDKIYNPVIDIEIKENIIDTKKDIDFVDMKFTKKHKSYMDSYFLDEEYLNSRDIYAVKSWAINKKKQKIDNTEYIFGYVYKDEFGNETGEVKLLRLGPFISKKDKWKTNVPNSKLWWTHLINKEDKNLFIVKSIKDASVLNKHFNLNCIITQNEDATILLQNNYDYLQNLNNEKIIAYGCDFQGWHSSYLITYLTGWKYFNIPNEFYDLDKVEDFSDFVKILGVENLKKLLIKKKFI